MTPMSLEDCMHTVWQQLTGLIDKFFWNGKESCLAGLIRTWLRLPSLPLHLTSDMLNNVQVWPILQHLDLLCLQELQCGD